MRATKSRTLTSAMFDVRLGAARVPRRVAQKAPSNADGMAAKIGRPRMRIPTAEDQLAGLTKSDVVVGDQRFHQEQIDQVPEPLVLLAGPWWKGHAMQLLRDVEPKWQARQLRRAA